jgi:hypothetical protein
VHKAVNTIIQGTASDLVKRAMLAIDVHLRSQKMKSRLLLQIHDELIYEVLYSLAPCPSTCSPGETSTSDTHRRGGSDGVAGAEMHGGGLKT